MTRALFILLGSQVVLEAALLGLFWVVPGGRAVLGIAPVLGLFGGAFATGRGGIGPDRGLIRRLALISGLVHAAVGLAIALSLGQAWFLPVVLGGMAWVLSIAGVDFGLFSGRW